MFDKLETWQSAFFFLIVHLPIAERSVKTVSYLFTVSLTQAILLTLPANVPTMYQGLLLSLTPPRQQMPITIYEPKQIN